MERRNGFLCGTPREQAKPGTEESVSCHRLETSVYTFSHERGGSPDATMCLLTLGRELLSDRLLFFPFRVAWLLELWEHMPAGPMSSPGRAGTGEASDSTP